MVETVKQHYYNGSWDEGAILGALSESRGIRVNGEFADLQNIPEIFARILCEGPQQVTELDLRRRLAIGGFVLPASQFQPLEEFQQYDWSNLGTKFTVANPLLAAYYRHHLQTQRNMTLSVKPREPNSCLDVLLRALPYLTFSKVTAFPVGRAEESPLSANGLPFEPQYNAAIIAELQNMKYEADVVHSSREGEGKVDIFLRFGKQRSFVLEGIMAAAGQTKHNQHRLRFENFKHSKDATHKGLYMIGVESDVKQRVADMDAEGVEIVGLVPSRAHTAYTIHYKTSRGVIFEPFTVPCDLVARRIEFEGERNFQVKHAQHFDGMRLSRAEAGPTPSAAASSSGALLTPTWSLVLGALTAGSVMGISTLLQRH